MPEAPVRVVVVSRSLVVREGVAALVGQTEGAVVVSVCAAVDEVPSDCDVVIYDLLVVRDLSAYADIRQLHQSGIAVIGLTADLGRTVCEPGEQVMTTVVPADVTPAHLRMILGKLPTTNMPASSARRTRMPAGLTDQEVRTLSLVGHGLSNQQIAEQMCVSTNTVKTYIRLAYRKIGVDSRAHAVLWALHHGLATPGVLQMDDDEWVARPR